MERRDFLVEGTPEEILNRAEARMNRQGYRTAAHGRTPARLSVAEPGGCTTLLLIDPPKAYFIVEAVGEGRTTLTVGSNRKGVQDEVEQWVREELGGEPWPLGSSISGRG